MLIFFLTRGSRILLFLIEPNKMKIDIIRSYLSVNTTVENMNI